MLAAREAADSEGCESSISEEEEGEDEETQRARAVELARRAALKAQLAKVVNEKDLAEEVFIFCSISSAARSARGRSFVTRLVCR